MEEIKKQHEEMLWPTVRVLSRAAAGSGTIVYSKPDAKGKYHTYVLTCEHVVDDLIEIEKKWDSIAKIDRRQEILDEATVELFYYEHFSRCKGSSGTFRAKIVAYDKDQDIALLELDKETPVEWIGALFPSDKVESELHIFDELYAVGAAMGHEPIATHGILSYMDEKIDGHVYWMSTAQMIFGNSGGAIYRYSQEREKYEFLGMPARITISMFGYKPDAITHMGFFVPISRIYNILKANFYHFIFDDAFTYEKCMEMREVAKKKQERLLMAKFGEVDETAEQPQMEGGDRHSY